MERNQAATAAVGLSAAAVAAAAAAAAVAWRRQPGSVLPEHAFMLTLDRDLTFDAAAAAIMEVLEAIAILDAEHSVEVAALATGLIAALEV